MEDLVSWLKSEPEKGKSESFVISKEWEPSDEQFYHVWLELVSLGGGDFAVTTNEEVNGLEAWAIINSSEIASKFQSEVERYQPEND